ncbi:hypothetical protein ACVI1L_004437 [Bradyrhizobium sp. USDA 4516]
MSFTEEDDLDELNDQAFRAELSFRIATVGSKAAHRAAIAICRIRKRRRSLARRWLRC